MGPPMQTPSLNPRRGKRDVGLVTFLKAAGRRKSAGEHKANAGFFMHFLTGDGGGGRGVGGWGGAEA